MSLFWLKSVNRSVFNTFFFKFLMQFSSGVKVKWPSHAWHDFREHEGMDGSFLTPALQIKNVFGGFEKKN